MVHGVIAYRVPFFDHPLHQIRIFRYIVTHEKECRRYFFFLQHIQDI